MRSHRFSSERPLEHVLPHVQALNSIKQIPLVFVIWEHAQVMSWKLLISLGYNLFCGQTSQQQFHIQAKIA